MDPIRRVIAAIDAALKRHQPLLQTIRELEVSIASSLALDDVSIVLGDTAVIAPAGALVIALRLDGSTVARVFATAPSGADRLSATGVLSELATPLALALAWRARDDDRERLTRIARTDALTGISNRLAFDERFESAWRRCREDAAPLGIALIDVDFFKPITTRTGILLATGASSTSQRCSRNGAVRSTRSSHATAVKSSALCSKTSGRQKRRWL